MDEPFEPEYVRPASPPCPDCLCCSQALCERGRGSVRECIGFTAIEHAVTVAGCPCSAETTVGTASWRVAKIRATRHAVEQPLPADEEAVLRALAGAAQAGAVPDDVLHHLRVRRYVVLDGGVPVLTEAGRTYLAARTDLRAVTPVEVLTVDVRSRTAQVSVVRWCREEPVTVLLDLLLETGLTAEELPGRSLEAVANVRAERAEDLVLTGVRIAGGAS